MGIFNEVIDITHHSKRTQAGNLEAAGVIQTVVNSDGEIVESKVPQNVTIERAIEYFKTNANGEFANLYNATVRWLEQYNTYSRTVVKKTTDSVATVDMSEVTNNE